MRRFAFAIAALLVAAVLPGEAAFAAPKPATTKAARPLRVVANKLVDDSGRVVQLRGVNRNSPEVLCIATNRTSYFHGPTDAASVAAIKAWGANVVRLPINEDCWLGRNGLPVSMTAADYRAQMTSYTRLLVPAGSTSFSTCISPRPRRSV